MKKFTAILLSLLLLLSVLVGCNDTDEEPNPESDFEFTVNDDGNVVITRYIGESSDVIIPAYIQGKPVTEIGFRAFVTKDTVIRYPSNVVTSLKMPDTVTIINDAAFEKCDQLENIIFSENLTQIGVVAFQECKSLKHVTIPSKVSVIGGQAFESSGLESVTLEDGIELIDSNAFANTQLKEVVLPSTVKKIGRSAFAACPNLESIVLNDGLVTIGHKAFSVNPKLKEIVIPKTVETVTEMDFTMCSGLERILFEGNAPDTFEYSDPISGVWDPYDVHFTIYYHADAEGFTSPEWYGYPTEIW